MAINREFLEANHADLVAAIRAEGHAAGVEQGRSEGATAERARIQAVEAAALPGCGELIAQLKYDGVTSGEQAASKVLAHYKGINAGALAALEKDAAALPKVPAAPTASGDSPKPAADSAEAYAAAIAAHEAAGMSRGKATAKAVRELPVAHAAWLKQQKLGVAA